MNAGPSDLRDMPKQPSKRTLQQTLRQMFGTSSGLVFESAGNPIEWTLYAQILTRIQACRFVACTTSDNRRRAVRCGSIKTSCKPFRRR